MKKMMIFSAVLLAIFFLPIKALAVDFTIDNTRIDAYLQDGGDVQVTEQHTYTFDGSFNGITRTLIPKKNSSIIDLKASENNQPLDVEQEDNLYKIHRSGKNETVTISLTYTIKNGVDVYADVAEFYWPFFDSSNESSYQNMNIYIHPPKGTENVITYGYDEAYDTESVDDNGVAHFNLGKVASGENGDIRVVYEASLFPSASLSANEPMKEQILADIAETEKSIAAFENRQDTLNNYGPFLVVIFIVYFTLLSWMAWRKKRMAEWEVSRNSLNNSTVPEEEMSLPAIIMHMKQGMINGGIITASLLNLVRKGLVKQESDQTFKVVDRNVDHKHERFLLEWLFDKIGSKGTFSISDLKAYMTKKVNQKYYHSDYQEFQQALREEIKQHDLFENKTNLRILIGLSSLVPFGLVIVFAVHELFLWMFLLILCWIAILVFAIAYRPRTQKGLRIKQQWTQFKQNFTNVNEKEWGQWMNDEQMRATIYAIGTNDKALTKKTEHMAKTFSNNSHSSTSSSSDIVLLVLLASTMNSSFDEANQTAHASTGGGTSTGGGGAGVGGGGGGSGAF